MTIKKIKVTRTKIEEEEPARLLIWGNDDNYHYIASVEMDIKIGDIIEVEPYGVNFGFVVKRSGDKNSDIKI